MDEARLIIDPALEGAWNMAVDQALLSTANTTGQAVLRFYRWSPATLSLGYFQSTAERLNHHASSSCAMVRRVTGGGAILHDHELTYSLCIPSQSRLASENQRLYRQAHGAVTDCLREWGILATPYSESEHPTDKSRFLCFERRSPGDLVVQGLKICGSAQRRSGRAILQHGSILLAQSEFAPELAGIREISGLEISPERLTYRLAERLGELLEVAFKPSQLAPLEQSFAQEIRQKQFTHHDWTYRR